MPRRQRAALAGLALLAIVAVFLFGTGLYHVTHGGVPSGVIELTMTVVVIAAGSLLAWASLTR